MLCRPDAPFAGYVFDLDGTVYMGDELLPGSARLLRALRELDRHVAFVSNNPTRTPSQYVDKLNRLGIEARESEVINTIVTTVRWLRRECADARVFAIAESPLLDALDEAGVRLTEDPAEVDVVVASFDRTLEYRKLQIAFDALWRRSDTRFVATNPDRYCPTPDGGQPDAGSVIAALEAATSRRCELHFGKPGAIMMHAVLDRLGAPPEECVMVGDRLSTDMQAARQIGMRGALVLTGETRAQDLDGVSAGERPDYVLARIDQLLAPDEWERLGWEA